MDNELYKAIKTINSENLTEEDKEELLRIFNCTRNSLLRDHIAAIFADLEYNPAVSSIIKKIRDKSLFNNHGVLIFSLRSLEAKKYFITLIRLICEHDYEARLHAYGLVEKYAPSISKSTKKKALQMLEKHRVLEEPTFQEETYANSRLQFIEATQELLN